MVLLELTFTAAASSAAPATVAGTWVAMAPSGVAATAAGGATAMASAWGAAAMAAVTATCTWLEWQGKARDVMIFANVVLLGQEPRAPPSPANVPTPCRRRLTRRARKLRVSPMRPGGLSQNARRRAELIPVIPKHINVNVV